MKISKDKFEELLSAYLDNEADKEELELLSKCVRKDMRLARIFYKACKLHAATCKMYGRPVRLKKLRGIKNVLESPDKYTERFAFLEWISIGGLAVAATLLFMVGPMAVWQDEKKSPPPPPYETARILIREYSKTPSEGFDESARLQVNVSPDSTAVGVLKFAHRCAPQL